MATLLVPNEGITYFWNLGVNGITQYASNNMAVRLFTTSHTPGYTDTYSTYSAIECALSGYSAQTLTSGSFTGTASGGVLSSAASTVTWTFSSYGGGTTIYGVYLHVKSGSSGTTNTCIGACLLDASYVVPSGGGSLSFNLTYVLSHA